MIERHALIALVLGGCAITGCQDAPQASIQEHGGSGDEPARVLLVETSTQRVLGVDSVAALASEISYSSSGPGTHAATITTPVSQRMGVTIRSSPPRRHR